MRRKSILLRMVLVWVGLTAALSANAQTLLIISDSGEIFGDGAPSEAMENFSITMVSHALSPQYRKIYGWSALGKVTLDTVWATILKERAPTEKIDIFAMEHGPNASMLDSLSSPRAIPGDFIRRFYSTACQNWGNFTANADGTEAKGTPNDALLSEFKNLGVEEWVIHANNNATGLLSLPYLLAEFRKGDSWISGAARATQRVDHDLAGLTASLKNDQNSFLLKALGEPDESGLASMLISRPAFGGKDFQALQAGLKLTAMIEGENSLVAAPSTELAKSLAANCPTIFQALDCPIDPNVPGSDPNVLKHLGLILRDIFSAYSDRGDGCAPPEVMQTLIDGMFKTRAGVSPKIKSFCVRSDGGDDVRVDWEFGPTPSEQTRIRAGLSDPNTFSQDIWEVKTPEGLLDFDDASIDQLDFERVGGLRIVNRPHQAEVRIAGVSFSGTAQGAPGILTRHLSVTKLLLKDGDLFQATIEAPFFNIPIKVDGKPNLGEINSIRVLGHRFQVN